MSLLSELKRRNVFRVAAAYVVTAWLLIEIGNTLEETLRLPEWADTLLAFFLIIGFPIALFVSWAYEITPEGIKREKDVDVSASSRSATARKLNQLIVVVMALGLVYFALDKWVFTAETTGRVGVRPEVAQTAVAEKPSQAAEQDLPPEDMPSVAVLPFVNMSPDPDNEYFSDGMSEELLNLLVKVEGLRVPSRTSSFAFKGMNTDIKDIARELQVGHILEGSVRKAGNRVRVTAQLIDVSTDTHLWSDSYDRELKDIFAIQDEIAGHIVDALQVVLGTEAAPRQPTTNLEAYNLFLQGRHLFQQRGPGLAEAERLLLQAVDLDPEFAEAWAVLAMTRVVAPGYLNTDWNETRQKAEDAADRALRLDPELAEPALAKAFIASRDRRLSEALPINRGVAASHPGNALAHLWLGITLLKVGYIDDAVKVLKRAVELDPVAAVNLDWFARALAMSGRCEQAFEPAQRALGLGRRGGGLAILFCGLGTGDLTRSREVLSRYAGALSPIQAWLLERKPGELNKAEFQRQVAQLSQDDQAQIATYGEFMFHYLREDGEAFYSLMTELAGYDDTIISGAWWGSSQWFRKSPLMQRLASEFGLMEAWREHGWPDLCRPLEDGGFTCD